MHDTQKQVVVIHSAQTITCSETERRKSPRQCFMPLSEIQWWLTGDNGNVAREGMTTERCCWVGLMDLLKCDTGWEEPGWFPMFSALFMDDKSHKNEC